MTLKFDRADRETIGKFLDDLSGSPADIKISKWHPPRSLKANKYFWTLINELSDKIGIPASDLYREYIKDVGGNIDTVCIKANAADAFCKAWEAHGLGWLTSQTASKIDGCVNVICVAGSSTFNSAQMQRLIQMVQEDCKENGIETLTPEELSRLEYE